MGGMRIRADEDEGISSLIVEESVLAGGGEVDEYIDVVMVLLERFGEACLECRSTRRNKPLCCGSIKRARR